MVYGVVILTHSWLRWAVLVLGVGVVVQRAVAWRRGGRPVVTPLHAVFIGALDTQVVFGLALYVVLSPLTRSAFGDLGGAMADPVLRFFSVEHVFGMLIAVAAAHIGFERLKRGARDAAGQGEHAPAAGQAGFALAAQLIWLLAVVVSIPWPFLPYGRPLTRLFF
jgi:hypothetical protein